MGMLVHTRRVGQRIMIDDDTEIIVLEIDGNKIRLGFAAPADVKIRRYEVWQKLQAEGDRASRAAAGPPPRERRRSA